MKKRDSSFLFLFSRFLASPLEAMYTLLIFILSKDLNADVLQITILASVKPLVSLVAFYVSSLFMSKLNKIRNYLVILNIVGCLPCLLFPFVQSVWYYTLSYILFMTTLRAAFPAWAEILKTNLGLCKMGNIVSKGTSINYCMTIFLPLILSYWLDQNKHIWKVLFFSLAILQILNTFVLLRVQLLSQNLKNSHVGNSSFLISLKFIVLSPWQKGWKLLREKPEFAQYLILFFLGGAGLVAVQPILPIFFKENLQLSYQQLTLAFSLCKGIAFVFSSPLWARLANKISLYLLNSYINLFSCLFLAFILAANGNTHWLFLAYLMYGTMQAGCELSWNLSGPIFSKEKESTPYSGLNLALIGIRGSLFPFIGQWIFLNSNASVIFMSAGSLCFLSFLYALWLDYEKNLITKKKNSTQSIIVI